MLKADGVLIPLSLGTARLIAGISEMELSKIHRFRFTPQALSESRELLPQIYLLSAGKGVEIAESIEHNFAVSGLTR